MNNNLEKIFVTFRNDEGKTFVVGELVRKPIERYYFKYNIEEAKKAMECGFELFSSMPMLRAEYFKEELFSIFKNRINNKIRRESEDISKDMNIEKNDDFEVLRITGGKSDKDTIEFLSENITSQEDKVSEEMEVVEEVIEIVEE